MPPYKRNEIEYFRKLESGYAEQFEQLDAETQQLIIKGLRRIANDSNVPKQEREIARFKARELAKLV